MSVSSSSRAVSKGVVSIGTWLFARSVASAIVSLILARMLGPELYGQYAYYLAVLVFAAPVANLGATSVMIKYLAERPDDLAWRKRIAAYALALNVLGTVVMGVLTIVFLTTRATGSEESTVLLTMVVAGALLAEQVWLYEKGLLYGLHREEQASLPAAMSALVAAGISIGLVLAGWGVLGGLLGVLVGNVIKAVVSGIHAIRLRMARSPNQGHEPVQSSSPAARIGVGALLTFGLSAMMLSLISQALYRIDVILILNWSTAEQAGLYASAVQWSEFVWMVSLAVQTIMLQSTARLWANNQLDELTTLLSRLLRYVALATALPLIVVFVFAQQILTLYFGAAYAQASLALQILAPGVLSFALARVLAPVIQSRGNAVPLIAVVGGAAIVNVALNWLLIPAWGANGAAVASAIAYGCVLFVYAGALRRYGVNPFAGFSTLRLLVLMALTVAALLPIARLIPSAPVAVLVGTLVAVAVYGLGVLWLSLLSVGELRQIIQSLPARLRRPGEKIFGRLQPALVWIESGLLKKTV